MLDLLMMLHNGTASAPVVLRYPHPIIYTLFAALAAVAALGV
jgi:hypothetical protein